MGFVYARRCICLNIGSMQTETGKLDCSIRSRRSRDQCEPATFNAGFNQFTLQVKQCQEEKKQTIHVGIVILCEIRKWLAQFR